MLIVFLKKQVLENSKAGRMEKLLIAYDYPHSFMLHMKEIVKEKGHDILMDENILGLFEEKFPDYAEEHKLLKEACRRNILGRFNDAGQKAEWAKRVCINQSLFLLTKTLEEKEAVIIVESLMYLFRWEMRLHVQRKWETSETGKADFHKWERNTFSYGANPSGMQANGKLPPSLEADKMLPAQDKTDRNTEELVNMADLGKEDMTEQQADIAGTHHKKGKKKEGRRAEASAKNKKYRANGKRTPLEEAFHEVKYLPQMGISMKKDVKRAKRGNADSQQHLGDFYAEEGTAHLDYTEAVYWYQKAAAQGNFKAQMELGKIFDSEKVDIADSKQQGIKWYRKLAEKGFPTAQCILGAKYLWGDGVEQDKSEAAKWLKKAAAQGYEEAEIYLSQIPFS